MVLGKNAESRKLTLLQTVGNYFGQLGQNAENYVNNTESLFLQKKNVFKLESVSEFINLSNSLNIKSLKT